MKHRAGKSKSFSPLYSDMGAEDKTLLLHTEMLKDVPRQNFELCLGAAGRNAITLWEKDPESSEELCDTLWYAQLTHLVHILLKLNTLNSSLQGEKEDFVSAGDEMVADIIVRKWGFVEFPRFRRCCRPAKTVLSRN